MSRTASVPAPQRLAEPGTIARGVGHVCKLIGYLILGLVFAILMEWLGLALGWWSDGVQHSRTMLQTELDYLGALRTVPLVPRQPAELAAAFATEVYHTAFERTGLAGGLQRLNAPPAPTDALVLTVSRAITESVSVYVVSAMTITALYAVRLTVLLFSLPVFVLSGVVGLTDGLVVRDRRRFGGARESSFVYHHAKRVVGPSIAIAWLLYLAIPFSVHPNLIILPSAVLFGLALGVSAATFKKHL